MKITWVMGDDWSGLYVDGERKIQGHSITARDVFEALNISPTVVYPDEKWLEDIGSLPSQLTAVRTS